MMTNDAFVVITPARNEQEYIGHTIRSMVAQNLRPLQWVIVDDGSSDRTGEIADAAARGNPWIKVIHLADRGFRDPALGAIGSIKEALGNIGPMSWEFLGIIDADIRLPLDYFVTCFDSFRKEPRLGIAGGLVCLRNKRALVAESPRDPGFHVRGAVKIYRSACWQEIGGLVNTPGWDTLDELKANMLGWKTMTLTHTKVEQLKETGSADGGWRNAVKNGIASYAAGYHPLFMFLKCVTRLMQKPFIVGSVGLWWGFCRGYLSSEERACDEQVIKYVRRQQLAAIFLRPSLWRSQGG